MSGESDAMPRSKLTPAERREKARLRSKRWHRRHGIPPRRPAATVAAFGRQPIHLYRRRAKGRHEAALAHAAGAREAIDRLQWQVAELRTHLDRLAAANAIMAQELSLFERIPSAIPSRK